MTRIRVDFRDANGPCPARACALRRLTDEDDFVLQIDSHTRFRSHWDAYLIDQLTKCDSEGRCSPPTPRTTTRIQLLSLPTCGQRLLVPSGFDKDGVLRIKGRRIARVHDKPIPSPLWCAGFSFCRAKVWRRVTYEPLPHLFFGEELLHAARFGSGLRLLRAARAGDLPPLVAEWETDARRGPAFSAGGGGARPRLRFTRREACAPGGADDVLPPRSKQGRR